MPDWANEVHALPVDAYAVLGTPGPDTTLRLWDLESGERRPLQGHDDPVIGALLLPDGRRALSWSEDRTLRLWDLRLWDLRLWDLAEQHLLFDIG